MKTATLTHTNNEQEGYTSKSSSLPRLSYNQALDLAIKLPGGAIRTVRGCSVDEMKDLVESCVATATKKGRIPSIEGLDYSQPLDKWFAVLELVLHGCSLPIVNAEVSA